MANLGIKNYKIFAQFLRKMCELCLVLLNFCINFALCENIKWLNHAIYNDCIKNLTLKNFSYIWREGGNMSNTPTHKYRLR